MRAADILAGPYTGLVLSLVALALCVLHFMGLW